MKRKLMLLNLVLVALIALAGWRLRAGWLAARDRERAVLGRTLTSSSVPPPPSSKPAGRLTAADYLEVAAKMLFSRDRNPTVVLDVAPPKPMPALPVAYGVFLFTQPPTVMLSEKSGAPQRGYRPGDKIGEFKLVAVSTTSIEFDWDGQKVVRSIEELRDHTAKAPEGPAPPPPPPAEAAKAITVITTPVRAGPGVETGGSTRACVAGDTSPAGTIADGYRKETSRTPFGESCQWVKVK